MVDPSQEVLKDANRVELVHQGGYSELKPSLAIDGEWLLEQILPSEPFSKIMGGPPLSLRSTLNNYLGSLIAEGVIPIIVFQGISISLTTQKSLDRKVKGRAEAWEMYANGNKEKLLAALEEGKKVPWEVYSEVIKCIRALGGEVMRAPYHQSSQLGYLENKKLVGAIMGSTDLLFYNPEKVVIKLYPETRCYDYILSSEIIEYEYDTTSESLTSAFILHGYWFGKKTMKNQNLKETIKKLKNSDYKALAPKAQDKEYLDNVHALVNSKIAIEYSPPGLFIKPDPLLNKLIPTRFTKEVYFGMGIIPLSPQLLTTVANQKLVELPPFADSDYYRELLRKLKPLRKKTISLFIENLPAEYSQTNIQVLYWFNQNMPYLLPYEKIDQLIFNFSNADLEAELSRQRKNMPDLQFCLKWHYDSHGETEPKIQSPIGNEETNLEGTNMIIAKVIFKCLENAGYISSTGKPMLFGKALMQCSPEWQTQAFYLQELLKFGILNGRTLGQTESKYLDNDAFTKLVLIPVENDDLRHQIRLISRVFSLIQPNLKDEPWTGTIDYDLSQFQALVKLITMTYQTLGEVLLLREYLSGRIGYSKALITAGESLPFGCHSNIGLGIAIKKLLLGESIDQIREQMPQMADLELDFRRGWHFWKNLLKILKTFAKYQSFRDENFFNEILQASKLLKSTLIRARIPVN
ncbi:unnamed protein product [Blepharisma stoltei]|uniref:XPG-I domain-containing protein n=1 Tax=Blepharisma stoltei TaxID=1481888 RepID=A0AAU9JBF5_9CILI|nr:unnamed protein product [Blepharisma stoltei]